MSSSEENPTVSFDSDVLDQLNTEEAKTLHQLTDELSSCGVGKIVNLPQIIVVGEQSAGKSSVLEAISHVRFPVNSGVCTRFATELVLRNAKETTVDVSVRYAEHSKKSKTFHREGFHDGNLTDIIKEAKECMGLSETSRDFSKDVLRLEISGPNMSPLTLVDLPGLYHTETENQSLQGKETVDQLITSYTKQANSIILVVIPASKEIPTHAALHRIKEHDPKLERTIGVITKPDLTKAGYAEERTHIRLAKNQEFSLKLKLGWHVLRNRAEDEDSLEARDANEAKFFETSAWASLPPGDRGVASLRKKLSRVLLNHIQNNLGSVVDDIEDRLRERREELDRLGPVRSTSEQRRTFLLDIAQRFHRLAECGIDGRYNDPFFGTFDETEHKFRAQLRNFNNAFDHILAEKGSKLAIVSPKDGKDSEHGVPEHLKGFLEIYSYDCPQPERILLKDLHTRLEKQAASNQGREFAGSPSRDLVIQLFQDQASPWKRIASFHIQQVTLVAKAFVDQIFRHVVGQPEASRTTEGILRNYVDTFFAKKQELLGEKLVELLRPFERGYAMPQDAEFQQMVRRRTMDRLSSWYAAAKTQGPNGREWSEKPQVLLTDVVLALEGPSQGQFGTGKVIDMMQAYYEMSRRTFADNVINLAVESCLVADLPEILTPTKVDRMTEAELEELAAQSEDTHLRRKNLKEEEIVLQQGLEKCRKYKPRGMTVIPFARSSPSASPKATALKTKLLFQSPLPSGNFTGSSNSSLSTPSSTTSSSSSKSPKPTSGSDSGLQAKATGKSTAFGTTTTSSASVGGSLFGSSVNSGSTPTPEAAQQVKPNGGLFGGQKPSSESPLGSKVNVTPVGGRFIFNPPSTSFSKPDQNGSQQAKPGSLFGGFSTHGSNLNLPSPQNQKSHQPPSDLFHTIFGTTGAYEHLSPEEARLSAYQSGQRNTHGLILPTNIC